VNNAFFSFSHVLFCQSVNLLVLQLVKSILNFLDFMMKDV